MQGHREEEVVFSPAEEGTGAAMGRSAGTLRWESP
jgi:hypothetical protein